MIDYENIYNTVALGLSEYLKCPVIRSNQNKQVPEYPYISCTITMPKSENKGTYGVYSDGIDRKTFTQTWSITVIAKTHDESVSLALKASAWLDYVGTVYLHDNSVVVQSVGGITNRDNFITNGYEYRNGFDVLFNVVDEIDNNTLETGAIDTVNIQENVITSKSYAEQIAELEKQLEQVNNTKTELENVIVRLKERQKGV